MPLLEHLRELRSRLFKAVLAIAVASIAAAFFYDRLLDLLKSPYLEGIHALRASGHKVDAKLVFGGIADPFTFQLKTSLVAGIIAASPVWLWQVWAFVVPAMHKNERRWSVLFAAVAGPLFATGALVGYYVLPKGIQILIGFTPSEVANYNSLPGYLSFVLRILLVFAIAFEIPLFVVLLNLAGVVKGRQLGRARPWIVIGVFVFAAVATPTTDPITMLFLAIPMTVLFFVSEVIARLIDRRRERKSAEGDYAAYSDEEASPLELDHRPEDERPSPLDDDD
ncbi:MAG: twin-arginine translocase subunit TatC [Nocardioidaceae bacterium]